MLQKKFKTFSLLLFNVNLSMAQLHKQIVEGNTGVLSFSNDYYYYRQELRNR